MPVADAVTPTAGALYPPTIEPPPRPLPLWRFLFRFVQNPLLGIPAPAYHEPLVQFATPRTRVVWVTDPALTRKILIDERPAFPKGPIEQRVFGEMLGNGILTAPDEDWRWQRQVTAPLFRHAELAGYVPAISAAAREQVERWRGAGCGTGTGEVQPIEAQMTETTFAVITRTILAGGDVFGADVIARAGADFLLPISWEIAWALLALPPWVPHPGRPRMRRATREMRGAVKEMVRRRREAGATGDDLFARLIRARHPETGEPMSERQLVDNLVTFISAGHETTAKALTWTLYLLARAPEWQARLAAEVETVAHGEPIAAHHVDRLPLTTQVIKEALRLYPPAPVLTRTARKDCRLGHVALPAGTMIVMPIYVIHRHRRLWTDPDRFDPDRFTPEREAALARTQYMPFGAGARICIGASFAMLEATAILATFLQHARFEWVDGHAPQPVSRVTLRPRGGMPLGVRLT